MKRLRNLLEPTGFRIGLLVTFFSLTLYGIGIPFFNIIELKAYDYHLIIRGKVPHGQKVAIVAIDEKSLDRFGRWPFRP